MSMGHVYDVPKEIATIQTHWGEQTQLAFAGNTFSLCYSKLRLKQLLHLDDFGESWIGDRGTGYTEKVVSN